jgi:hypothetical protein
VILQRNGQGQLDAYAWPGGYPIVYFAGDGGVICPTCANTRDYFIAPTPHADQQWLLVAADIHWEGPPLQCDGCNADIESAYGEPESEVES